MAKISQKTGILDGRHTSTLLFIHVTYFTNHSFNAFYFRFVARRPNAEMAMVAVSITFFPFPDTFTFHGQLFNTSASA